MGKTQCNKYESEGKGEKLTVNLIQSNLYRKHETVVLSNSDVKEAAKITALSFIRGRIKVKKVM